MGRPTHWQYSKTYYALARVALIINGLKFEEASIIAKDKDVYVNQRESATLLYTLINTQEERKEKTRSFEKTNADEVLNVFGYFRICFLARKLSKSHHFSF